MTVEWNIFFTKPFTKKTLFTIQIRYCFQIHSKHFIWYLGAEPEEKIDFDFAQNELLLNEFDSLGGKSLVLVSQLIYCILFFLSLTILWKRIVTIDKRVGGVVSGQASQVLSREWLFCTSKTTYYLAKFELSGPLNCLEIIFYLKKTKIAHLLPKRESTRNFFQRQSSGITTLVVSGKGFQQRLPLPPPPSSMTLPTYHHPLPCQLQATKKNPEILTLKLLKVYCFPEH